MNAVGWQPANTSCSALPTVTESEPASVKALEICGVAAAVLITAACLFLGWRWKRKRNAALFTRPTELSSLSSSLLGRNEQSEAVDGGVDRSRAAASQFYLAQYSSDHSPPSNMRHSHSYSYYVSLYEVALALDDEVALRQGEHIEEWALEEEPTPSFSSPSTPTHRTDSPAGDETPPIVRPRPHRGFDSPILHGRPPLRLARSRSPFLPQSSRALSSPAALTVSPIHSLTSDSVPRTTILRSSLKNLTVLPTFVDEVEDLTPLGEGSAGRVYCGYHRGLAVVVKLPKSPEITGAQWREWQAHLRLPPHPHLVTFIGALVMEHNNYLVTKLVQQGSLKGLLSAGDGTDSVGESHSSSFGGNTVSIYSRRYAVLRAAHELCSVLCHMHRHNLVHRDVSARNVLVDSDGSFVLADLGLCQEMSNSATTTAASSNSSALTESINVAIPVRWTAPESLLTGEFDSKSDVWSLGVTLWEMSSGGALPYGEARQTPDEQQRMIGGIVRGQLTLKLRDDERKECGEDEVALMERVRRLIALCLTRDAEKRPDSELLLQVIEKEIEEWERDGGEAVQRVKRTWSEYHSTLSKK